MIKLSRHIHLYNANLRSPTIRYLAYKLNVLFKIDIFILLKLCNNLNDIRRLNKIRILEKMLKKKVENYDNFRRYFLLKMTVLSAILIKLIKLLI